MRAPKFTIELSSVDRSRRDPRQSARCPAALRRLSLALDPFMKSTDLFTPRLRLSNASFDDCWELWELWRQPDVRRHLFGDAPFPLERAISVLEACVASAPALWLVRSPQTSNALGCVALCSLDVLPGSQPHGNTSLRIPELSVALLPSVWQRGYAAEAAHTVLDHAFGALGMRSVTSVCDANDRRGRAMLDRLGFTQVGERAGAGSPQIAYLLLASDVVAAASAKAW